jgi:Dolichyl-phosphate-mannose-protein mannosyltransferase
MVKMKHRDFWIIFILVVATRFAYFLHARPYRAEADGSYGRMYEMEASADRLAREGRIGDVFGEGSGPSAHVAPLYAGYLAILDRMAGLDVGRFRFLQGIGSILATALFAALLPGLATRAKLSPGVGLMSGCLVALSPFGLWLEIRGDWETAFLPLGLLALFRVMLAMQDRGWADTRLAILAGLAFGLGALLSPVVLLAGLAGLFAQSIDGRVRLPRLFRAGAIVLLVCAMTVAPWVYRNYRCFTAFVPIRDNLGIELAVGNNPHSDGTTFGGGMAVHPLGSEEELARLRELGEIRYNRAKLHEATDWIAANPSRFVRLTADRATHFWFPHDRGMLGALPHLPIRVQAIALGLASALALGGLIWLIGSGHPYRALFAAMLLAPSLPYLITHVSYRYRYPINGFVFLLGCECLARTIALYRRHALASESGISDFKSQIPDDQKTHR